jgi:hypothetical protein
MDSRTCWSNQSHMFTPTVLQDAVQLLRDHITSHDCVEPDTVGFWSQMSPLPPLRVQVQMVMPTMVPTDRTTLTVKSQRIL